MLSSRQFVYYYQKAMDKFEEFQQRINRALANMEAKISFVHQSVGEMKASFEEFTEEMNDFMQYMAERVMDHEDRLSRVEKRLDNLGQSPTDQ